MPVDQDQYSVIASIVIGYNLIAQLTSSVEISWRMFTVSRAAARFASSDVVAGILSDATMCSGSAT